MAQIRKFNTGGVSSEGTNTSDKKYGKIIKYGQEIEVTDKMLDWLNQQGFYGEQIRNKLISGENAFFDKDINGVNIMRGISLENPGLRDRQQQKLTRSERWLEGRRLKGAREEIDSIINNIDSLAEQKEELQEYDALEGLTVSYIKDRNGNTIIAPGLIANDAIKRIKELSEGKISSPEGFGPYKKTKEILDLFKSEESNYSSANGVSLYSYLENGLKNGTLKPYDWELLGNIGIFKQEDNDAGDDFDDDPGDGFDGDVGSKEIAAANKNAAGKPTLDKNIQSVIRKWFDIKNGKYVPKSTLKLGNHYVFTKYDSNGLNDLEGWSIIDGFLYKNDRPVVTNFRKGNKWNQFINLYKEGKFQAANNLVGFAHNAWKTSKQDLGNYYPMDIPGNYIDLTGVYSTDNISVNGDPVQGVFATFSEKGKLNPKTGLPEFDYWYMVKRPTGFVRKAATNRAYLGNSQTKGKTIFSPSDWTTEGIMGVGGTNIKVKRVQNNGGYTYEISRDGGATWTPLTLTGSLTATIIGELFALSQQTAAKKLGGILKMLRGNTAMNKYDQKAVDDGFDWKETDESQYNSIGEQVKAFQAWANKHLGLNLKVDGYYGDKTAEAWKNYKSKTSTTPATTTPATTTPATTTPATTTPATTTPADGTSSGKGDGFGKNPGKKGKVDWANMAATIAERIIPNVLTDKSSDILKEGFEKQALANLKSAAIEELTTQLNLNPMIRSTEAAKAESLAQARNISKSLSDSRLRQATMSEAVSNNAKKDTELSALMSKTISEHDAQSLKLKLMGLKEAREIVGQNNIVRGNLIAKLATLSAEKVKHIGDNLTKGLAEDRENYNKFLQSKHILNSKEEWRNLYNQWQVAKNAGEKEKAEILYKQLSEISDASKLPYLINPWTFRSLS